MSFSSPEKKFSTPKKAWKSLMSALQKKVKYLKKSKPHNKTSQYLLSHQLALAVPPDLQHHHHYNYHYKHYHHDHYYHGHQSQPIQNCIEIKYAEPLRIEASHVDPDTEIIERRVLAKRVLASSDVKSEGYNKVDVDDREDDYDDADKSENGGSIVTSSETTLGLQLHGVDAVAEEFINKMKRCWTLERQKSDEDYVQRWTRLYED